MKFILGTKKYMTQIFTEDGKAVPVTVVVAEPMTVTQVKTKAKDGYSAVQVGAGVAHEINIAKPQKGHANGLGLFRHYREFPIAESEEGNFTVGAKISADIFVAKDTVTVTGTSKGKGFQGVVKRHHFKGGPRTHGQKHSENEAGSIGGGLRTHVPKGMRMAGRMGGERVTVKGLTVAAINAEAGQILITGAVPGVRGAVVEIKA